VNELKIFVEEYIKLMVNKISKKHMIVKHLVEVQWINYNFQRSDEFDV
jgi:hypothetical protein